MSKVIFFFVFFVYIHGSSALEKTGDILQILIPAMGYGTVLYLGDDEGQNQFYKSFGTNLSITYALKYSINRQRPNGADYSFPSGHTSSAFQGASFIHQRYGLGYAIPAYLGGILVGYSRVKAKAHYTSDVVFGAVLGTLSTVYFTTSYQDYTLAPQNMGSGYGIEVKKKF